MNKYDGLTFAELSLESTLAPYAEVLTGSEASRWRLISYVGWEGARALSKAITSSQTDAWDLELHIYVLAQEYYTLLGNTRKEARSLESTRSDT